MKRGRITKWEGRGCNQTPMEDDGGDDYEICTHGEYEDHVMDFEAHENWEDCGDGDSDEAGLK